MVDSQHDFWTSILSCLNFFEEHVVMKCMFKTIGLIFHFSFFEKTQTLNIYGKPIIDIVKYK
jgi:hypothetical protein